MNKQEFKIVAKYKNGRKESIEFESSRSIAGVVGAYGDFSLLANFYNEGKEIKELIFKIGDKEVVSNGNR